MKLMSMGTPSTKHFVLYAVWLKMIGEFGDHSIPMGDIPSGSAPTSLEQLPPSGLGLTHSSRGLKCGYPMLPAYYRETVPCSSEVNLPEIRTQAALVAIPC